MLESINRNQWKLFGLIGGVLIIVIVLISLTNKPGVTGNKFDLALTVWGTGLTSAEVQPVLDAFSSAYANRYGNKIKVTYQSWPLDEYEEILVNKIAEGKGPDVAFVKNTWMLKHYTKLIALPENFTGYLPRVSERDTGIWSVDEYERVFVKTVPKDFVLSKKIYAFPLFVDSLGLYYNEDHFRQGGIAGSRPAGTWGQLATQVPDLVRKNPSNAQIRRAAVALGTVGNIRLNVQRADDPAPTALNNGAGLISLFLLQHGGAYCAENCTSSIFNQRGMTALESFLRFSTPEDSAYTWSPTFTADLKTEYVDDDVDAFVNGDVSAIIGYSDLLGEITSRAKGKELTVKVAGIPQEANADGEVDRRVSAASYWGVAVTKSAKTKFNEADVNNAQAQAALEMISFLGRYEQQLTLFRASKRPPAREDLVRLASDEAKELAPFMQQSQIAETATIYDEGALLTAITDAFEATPPDKLGAGSAIERAISEALRQMTQNPGRTPVPPKPEQPRGTR